MSKFDLNHVSQQYFDILKELGNIGAGNATTALAQMLGCKVDMKVPQVKLLKFQEVGAAMGGEEQIMAEFLHYYTKDLKPGESRTLEFL